MYSQVDSSDVTDLNINLGSECTMNVPDSSMASVSVPKTLFGESEDISILLSLFNSPSLFRDMSSNNLTVNTMVIGISINNFTQLSENITLHFQLQRSVSLSLIFLKICSVFIDFFAVQWDSVCLLWLWVCEIPLKRWWLAFLIFNSYYESVVDRWLHYNSESDWSCHLFLWSPDKLCCADCKLRYNPYDA